MGSDGRASAGRSVETIAARSAKGYLDSSAALAVLLAIATGAGSARALDQGGSPLGKVEFANSCAAGAQPELNQAMALLHHMTYPRAKAEFAQVRAAEALKDDETARRYYAALVHMAVRDSNRAGLKEATAYVDASPS